MYLVALKRTDLASQLGLLPFASRSGRRLIIMIIMIIVVIISILLLLIIRQILVSITIRTATIQAKLTLMITITLDRCLP